MHHTISIFKYFTKHISPVIPEKTNKKIKIVLEDLENNRYNDLQSVESLLISLGYELWPWNQAFNNFLFSYENKIGEEFLLSNLSEDLQEKYNNYKLYGLDWRDIYSGKVSSYFSVEERLELVPAFIEMKKNMRHYVSHKILGLSRKKYLDKVNFYNSVLEKIKKHFESLKELAEKTEHKEHLPKSIHSRIRGFEYGLCFLGPELKYNDVKESVDYFYGREKELNRLRGINIPLEVNFY